MNITQHLRQWGNAAAIRLPKKVLEAADLELGQTLSIRLEGRSIVLTPVENNGKPTLNQLLHRVTPEKVSGELVWGPDQGLENYD